ncbi:DUF2071 domain-containing protein [Chitinophaga filiformis]|uniref:DUF2071 domain-containing protein n=1 Tax=Chitinophaga filiformis TaxID=104663 RepID=UPI001F1C628F|nr:DUF2071 domain-containing protein [Chitinophaga filiformis]MCF6407249.1 DUF2071 domain-containing protein [Chitinophaga filiformis]
MFSGLRNHPFAVKAVFESSIVLTFAVAKEKLLQLIPACLELDTFDNKYGFIAVAMVQTKKLRPEGFPGFMGNNFFLIGYRVFVRYTDNAGKNLRGLYILKSETNKKKMEILGNIFTHYNYTTTDITQVESGRIRIFESAKSKFKVSVNVGDGDVILPATSPFADWKQARRFAGPLPFTFQFNTQTKEVLIIEGVRQNWTPKPLKVIDCSFSFFDSLNIESPVLANAFIINNVPYYWKKGKREVWKQ